MWDPKHNIMGAKKENWIERTHIENGRRSTSKESTRRNPCRKEKPRSTVEKMERRTGLNKPPAYMKRRRRRRLSELSSYSSYSYFSPSPPPSQVLQSVMDFGSQYNLPPFPIVSGNWLPTSCSHRGLCPEVKRLRREADHSPSSSVKIKIIMWSDPFTPPYVFYTIALNLTLEQLYTYRLPFARN